MQSSTEWSKCIVAIGENYGKIIGLRCEFYDPPSLYTYTYVWRAILRSTTDIVGKKMEAQKLDSNANLHDNSKFRTIHRVSLLIQFEFERFDVVKLNRIFSVV